MLWGCIYLLTFEMNRVRLIVSANSHAQYLMNVSPVDQKMDGQDPQKPDSTFFNDGTQSSKLIVDNL